MRIKKKKNNKIKNLVKICNECKLIVRVITRLLTV